MTGGRVRIPADVELEDQVLGPLTARQLVILASAGALLYSGWLLTRSFLPVVVFLVPALPVAVGALLLALVKRDGLSLDRLLLAAVRQWWSPTHQVAAPEGVLPAPDWITAAVPGDERSLVVCPTPLRLPVETVTEAGVLDLGADGVALVAAAGTVPFSLRSPEEQEALVAVFGRYLHSLNSPVQVLVRTEHLDLSGQIAELREHAGTLPHPALEAAAREHADFLAELCGQGGLLCRQVLLVLREPTVPARRGGRAADSGARRAAETRLAGRLAEAVGLLAPAGIVVTPLDAVQATAVLASACGRDSLIPPGTWLAGAEDVITREEVA